MSTELLLILLFISVGFSLLYFFISKQLKASKPEDELENLVNQVFGKSIDKITAQSKEVLSSERKAIDVNLENKQKAIEKLVKNLQDDIKDRQEEIRGLEQDRNKKFASITTAIAEHREQTKDLQASTQALAKVLSNNQTRGQWGERIIEDLLKSQGLHEGLHYLRQSKLGSTSLIPDITLLLPQEHKIAVDVKFPYSEIQKMSVAETRKAKGEHLKQFERDLKIKIKKVAEYINPEQNTLDYAIMFVPNETVFSFINQKLAHVVDEAIQNRVMLVSPFTFMAVAGMVRESYKNFMMEKNLRQIINYVQDFTKEWLTFKEEFGKFGRSIDTLKTGFEKITTTRSNQMDRKIAKIEKYQLESGK
ncbi:MAG: DNA recombination protein RmuC [Patescibacteria group bacterium]